MSEVLGSTMTRVSNSEQLECLERLVGEPVSGDEVSLFERLGQLHEDLGTLESSLNSLSGATEDKFKDFYTRVGIAGAPADTLMKETKRIENDWTVVWNEEFTFPLTVPELVLLRVEVHEYDMTEKDDFAGQTCLPVSELKMGIRDVQTV